jgi:ubiquinone/menaquinone biosynthesis C-methylase UbiE
VSLLAALGRRFARLVTIAVVRAPWLWGLFRRPLGRQFDWLAPHWDQMRTPGHLEPFEAALAAIQEPPRRALDLGTGTGAAAQALAKHFPAAQIVGVDLSSAMINEARRKLPVELEGRVRFEVGDSAALSFEDSAFELAALANMIPFFDELARVIAPGGHAVFSFSNGEATPIFVPPERLRRELTRRGFTEFAEFSAGPGTALTARRAAERG